jgi:hypothetical protein
MKFERVDESTYFFPKLLLNPETRKSRKLPFIGFIAILIGKNPYYEMNIERLSISAMCWHGPGPSLMNMFNWYQIWPDLGIGVVSSNPSGFGVYSL